MLELLLIPGVAVRDDYSISWCPKQSVRLIRQAHTISLFVPASGLLLCIFEIVLLRFCFYCFVFFVFLYLWFVAEVGSVLCLRLSSPIVRLTSSCHIIR